MDTRCAYLSFPLPVVYYRCHHYYSRSWTRRMTRVCPPRLTWLSWSVWRTATAAGACVTSASAGLRETRDTRANSDRDLKLVTNILRRAEETPERREEDRLPPFMSSVTYKVPWDSSPESEIHPLPTITGGVTNYYKCFFRIFYTQKINETKFGVI